MSKRKKWTLDHDRKRDLIKLCWMYDSLKATGRGDITRAIEQAAREADPYIFRWLLIGVTKRKPYTALHGIPCGIDYYYDRRKKFFWKLDKILSGEEGNGNGGGPGC